MIHYEEMSDAHIASIAALEKICFSDPWSENSIASERNNPLSLWLVAMEENTLVGYIGSQSVEGESDMMNIAVHPGYRRQGIGYELITRLVSALTKKGNRSLTLEVRQSNDSAIALYEKMGFIQVGLRPNYYRNPKENALILRKEWEV